SKWYTVFITSCQVVPDAAYGAVPQAERAANRALDRLEDACPAVLQPRRTVTFLWNGQWLRRYGNTDVDVWVSGGHVHFESALGGDPMRDLGPLSAWE